MISQNFKTPTLFFVVNGSQYLYYNKAMVKGGYHFKEGKEGASTFSRYQVKKVLKYLKQHGHYTCKKKKVR